MDKVDRESKLAAAKEKVLFQIELCFTEEIS